VTWLVVVNPGAGKRNDVEERTHRGLAAHGVEAEVRVSTDGAHIATLIAEGKEEGFDRFVAVGGDGTANAVVDSLLRLEWPEPPTFAILPAGTGSDFVRTFGRSQVLEDSLQYLVGDETYAIDVGHIQGPWGDRYFINVAEAGLGAVVVRIADRLPARWGAFRYKAAIWPALARFPQGEVSITVGERQYTGPATLVVMANAQFFGGGMNVAPKAMLVDGALDVQVLTGSKRQALVLQPMVTRGTHLRHPSVRRMSGSRVLVASAAPWPVEADGEYLGEGNVEASVLPRALRFKT
jgi:YegS/Rv2252/BmrU family lipid kinase